MGGHGGGGWGGGGGGGWGDLRLSSYVIQPLLHVLLCLFHILFHKHWPEHLVHNRIRFQKIHFLQLHRPSIMAVTELSYHQVTHDRPSRQLDMNGKHCSHKHWPVSRGYFHSAACQAVASWTHISDNLKCNIIGTDYFDFCFLVVFIVLTLSSDLNYNLRLRPYVNLWNQCLDALVLYYNTSTRNDMSREAERYF